MGFQAFPVDVFVRIIECLVVKIGIRKAVRLRAVSRIFNLAILTAVCSSRVVDIDDPATPELSTQISPALKGRILLTKSRSRGASEDRTLSVVASVNQDLDALKQSSEAQQAQQHQLIAEAVADMNHRTVLGTPHQDAGMRGQNAFSGAIVLGNRALVQELLENQHYGPVDVNTESFFFGRPLQLAAAWGHLAIVTYLLHRGADPTALSKDSYEDGNKDYNSGTWLTVGQPHVYRSPRGSALRSAALAGHREIVRLLLRPAYRLSTAKAEFFNAVLATARNDQPDLAECLLQETGRSAAELATVKEWMFWDACRHGREQMARMLLSSGVDVNMIIPRKGECDSGLRIAAAQGELQMVQFLLDNGADPGDKDSKDPGRRHPIWFAALGGHEDVVNLFLAHGTNPAFGLAAAATGAQARLVQWFLNEYPTLCARPLCARKHHLESSDAASVGAYALLMGVFNQNPAIITALAKAGAPLDELVMHTHRPLWREYPITLAKMYQAKWIGALLLSLGAKDRDESEGSPPKTLGRRASSHMRSRPLGTVNEPPKMSVGGVYVSPRTVDWIGKY